MLEALVIYILEGQKINIIKYESISDFDWTYLEANLFQSAVFLPHSDITAPPTPTHNYTDLSANHIINSAYISRY